jgi:hypothetical protein
VVFGFFPQKEPPCGEREKRFRKVGRGKWMGPIGGSSPVICFDRGKCTGSSNDLPERLVMCKRQERIPDLLTMGSNKKEWFLSLQKKIPVTSFGHREGRRVRGVRSFIRKVRKRENDFNRIRNFKNAKARGNYN